MSDKFKVICVPRKSELNSNFINAGITTTFSQLDLKRNEGYLFNYHETEIEKNICAKIDSISKPLSTYLNVTTGVKPYQRGKGIPKQTKDIVVTKPFNGTVKIDDTWLPYMKGENIEKYTDKWDGEYLKYGEWLAEPRKATMFSNEKIFIRQTSDTLIATYDNTGKVCKNTLHCIYKKEDYPNIDIKFILALINSKLLNWKFQHDNFHIVGKPLAETKVIYVNRLPIIYPTNTIEYTNLVDKLLQLNQLSYELTKQFIKFIELSYNPKKISNKLWNFYNIEYIDFVKELQKQKVKLSESTKFELMQLFDNKKQEIRKKQEEIDIINKQLDNMIYKLYKLNDEEIHVINNK